MRGTWSTETIRNFAHEGGGVLPCPMHVINDAGDDVVWDVTGEVRTVALRGTFVLRSYRGSTTAGGGSCDMETVEEWRT